MSLIPGQQKRRTFLGLSIIDALILLVLAIILYYLYIEIAVTRQMELDFAKLRPYLFYYDKSGELRLGLLIRAFFVTLSLGFWSLVLALFTGSIIGFASVRRQGFSALPSQIYISIMRNTPPLVLLLLIYFFSGSFFSAPITSISNFVYTLPTGLQDFISVIFAPPAQMDRMFAAVLTLGLYEGAYIAEIVRSGLESVPKSQREAAKSQGFSKFQALRYIITPQAFKVMLPPLIGQTISTFKDSALASIVSLPELSFQSLEVMARTRQTYELWLVTALMYLSISLCCSRIGHYLESRRKWQQA